MSEKLLPYECQFTNEERRNITAQVLKELRLAKGYSQKEVAADIQIKPTTYNTYESGRTEPPQEVLVRLSYLYKVPLDIIMQRDRLYRTTEDLTVQLAECERQLAEIDEKLKDGNMDNPVVLAMKEALEKLVEQIKLSNEREIIQSAINKYTMKTEVTE